MIQSISIVSRDTSCIDCKLIMRRVVENKPGWIKRLFGAIPVTEIIVDEWYGYADKWYPRAGSDKKTSIVQAIRFHNLWTAHCHERNKTKLFGSFRTIFVFKDEQWELKDSTKL